MVPVAVVDEGDSFSVRVPVHEAPSITKISAAVSDALITVWTP